MTDKFKFQLVFEALTQTAQNAVRGFANAYRGDAKSVVDSSAAVAAATKAAEAAIGNLLEFKTGGQLALSIQRTATAADLLRSSASAAAKEVTNGFAPAAAAADKLRGSVAQIPPAANAATASFSSLGRSLLAAAGIGAGLAGVAQGVREIVQAGVEFERVNNVLRFATGSIEAGAAAYQLAADTANRYGLSLDGLTKGLGQLSAATKGSRLEGEATEQLFIGISQAAATLGLSVADTNGVITALGQTASKGQVSLEELRGQLGERLPGVLSVAAKGLGQTEAGLLKLVEAGLDSTVFLKAFGPALQQAFGGGAAANVQTLGGQITLLQNQLQQLFISLSQGAAGDAVRSALSELGGLLSNVQGALTDVDPATVQALSSALSAATASAKELFNALLVAGGSLFEAVGQTATAVAQLVQSFSGIQGSVEQVNLLTRAVQGLGVLFGFIVDGVRTLGIALDVVAGSFLRAGRDIANGLAAISFGDVSAGFARLAQDLDATATAALTRAERAATDFKSAGVAALDATVVSAGAAGSALAKVSAPIDSAAQKLKAVAPAAQSALQALVDMGATGLRAASNVTESTAKAVVELSKLGAAAGNTGNVLRQELNEAINGAKTAADVKLISDVVKTLGVEGKLSGDQLQAALQAVGDKSRAVAGIIEGAMGDTLKRLGIQTKAGLQAALEQAQQDLQRVQALAAQGVVGLDAVQTAQNALSAAQSAATPGAATLADVTARLAQQNVDYAASAQAAAAAQAAATAAQAGQAAQTDTLTTAVGGLANQWAAWVAELTSLSPAAATQFGNDFGVSIAGAGAAADDAAAQLREIGFALADISANRVIADFTGLAGAAEEISISGLRAKRAFLEQKIEADKLTESLTALTDSSDSVGAIQNAIAAASQEFTLLDDNDLANLRSAIDNANNRVEELRRNAQQAVDDFRELGDSIETELLRAKGLNEEATKAEFERRRQDIKERLDAAGSNDEARREAERALSLLDQLEQEELNKERQRNASTTAAGRRGATPAPAPAPATAAPSSPANTAPTTKTEITFRDPATGKTTTGSFDKADAAEQLLAMLRAAGATSVNKAVGAT